MKLYCLSNHPNKPCNVLQFKGMTIMLDCGLDMSSLMNFLPLSLVPSARLSGLPSWNSRDVGDVQMEGEIKECSGRFFVDSLPEFIPPQSGVINYSDIDVILVSNYMCMLALPYITEESGFNGVVYATEPTLNIGRQFMEELIHYVERSPRTKWSSRWKHFDILKLLPPPLNSVMRPKSWKHLYTMKDANSSLARVQIVGFNEKRDVFGALRVTPVSSGFCLGSCNFLIESDYEKIVYISGSSTLTTHPKPIDQSSLKNADVLILCSLTQTPTYNPDSMLGDFCMHVALTVRNGGNVLVPVYPSGVTYDLFECLAGHLEGTGLGHTPMFFISPVAEHSLAYSNILAEWLSTGKQNKVYLPEEPFPHAQLVKGGHLKHFPNIHSQGFSSEFCSPCIMFTGHPSLRFGDAVHFVELWGGSHQNTIIFTEPDFPYLDALSPYQPLAMKVSYCPIDTGLNFSQANKLIRDLKPLHLVIPEQYSTPPLLHPTKMDLTVDSDPPPILVKQGEIITLPAKRFYEKVELDMDLAACVTPSEVRPGVALSTLTGQLLAKDNKYSIKPLQKMNEKTSVTKKLKQEEEQSYPGCYTWGTPDVYDFIKNMEKRGIKDITKEETSDGFIVHLQSEDTLIQVEDTSTHIVCKDRKLRCMLRDSIVDCLNKF